MIPVIKKPDGTYACGSEEDREPEVGELYIQAGIWGAPCTVLVGRDSMEFPGKVVTTEHVGWVYGPSVFVKSKPSVYVVRLDRNGVTAFEAWEAKKRKRKCAEHQEYLRSLQGVPPDLDNVPVNPRRGTIRETNCRCKLEPKVDVDWDAFRKGVRENADEIMRVYRSREQRSLRHELVSVQPMTRPTSKIFYADVTYQSTTMTPIRPKGYCPKCGRRLESIPLLTGFSDVCPECDK